MVKLLCLPSLWLILKGWMRCSSIMTFGHFPLEGVGRGTFLGPSTRCHICIWVCSSVLCESREGINDLIASHRWNFFLGRWETGPNWMCSRLTHGSVLSNNSWSSWGIICSTGNQITDWLYKRQVTPAVVSLWPWWSFMKFYFNVWIHDP